MLLAAAIGLVCGKLVFDHRQLASEAERIGDVEIGGKSHAQLVRLLGEARTHASAAFRGAGGSGPDTALERLGGGVTLFGPCITIEYPFRGSLHGIHVGDDSDALVRKYGGSMDYGVAVPEHSQHSSVGDCPLTIAHAFKLGESRWIGWGDSRDGTGSTRWFSLPIFTGPSGHEAGAANEVTEVQLYAPVR
jgi:hypothetical protein